MSTEREQIDKLVQALTSIQALGLSIQDHSDPNHLIVFQETEDGSIHQLLIGITYIGITHSSKNYPLLELAECKATALHLTNCNENGHCNFCGHQP